MKSYTVYHEFDENDCLLWHVFENTTQQVISTFIFEDDAQEYCRFLEKGGAFAGFTPSFVLKKTHSIDINDAFAAEFAE
mgnify:CR=1 FL=1